MHAVIVLEATLGGIRKHVVALVHYLHATQHSITFVYSTKRADAKFLADIEHLKQLGIICIELPMRNSIFHPMAIYCIFRLAKLFQQKRNLVIHLHGAVAGALGRIASVLSDKNISRVIYSPHGGVLHKLAGLRFSKLYLFIEKCLKSKKLLYIAVSKDEKEKIIHYLNVPEFQVRLIPNGLNYRNIQKNKYAGNKLCEIRSRMNFTETDFIILYPALFLEAKGHINFFKTIRTHNMVLSKNIHIILAGDGPLKRRIEALVKDQNLQNQVHFKGFVNNIEEYFQIADAVILPSVNEAFGYVLLEAMAYQKPIFATKVGGIPDIISGGKHGFLYHVANIREMIEDLNYYSSHPNDLRNFVKEACLVFPEQFDETNTLQKIAECYKY